MGLSTELKVGSLILTGAILVVVASITLTGWNPELAETYQVHVLFDNVSGLQPRSAVRIAGIKVGSVERIELSGKKARVYLEMRSEYPIYQDSQATIKSVGILGDKYIELEPGNSLQIPLQDGDEIERILTGTDLDSLVDNFSDALNDIKSITGAMRRSFGGSQGEERFNQILTNVEELTDSVNQIAQVTNSRIDGITRSLEIFSKDLSQITQDNKKSIGQIVTNFQKFSEELQVITTENRKNIQTLVTNVSHFSTSLAKDGPAVISDLKDFSEALAEDVPQITSDLQAILSDNKDKFNSSMDNLDRAFQKLDHVMANMESISDKINAGEGTVGKLINEEETVEELNSALEAIKEVADNLKQFSIALSEDGPAITNDLRGILSENRANLKDTIENLGESSVKLDRTMKNIESISQKIDEGKGTVGKLINEEKTVDKLNSALENINNLLGSVERTKLDFSIHAEFMSKNQSEFGVDSQTKGYFGIQLQPLKDRFYLLQIVSNPRGRKTRSKEITLKTLDDGTEENVEQIETTISDELLFSAQVIQRYYDTQFKIGLFESQFGLGVEQFFGRDEQFRIGLDAWDFGNEFGAHLKLNTYWRFHSNLFFVAGADDFISEEKDFRDNYIGIGISFNEDILKPYLGSIPLQSLQ